MVGILIPLASTALKSLNNGMIGDTAYGLRLPPKYQTHKINAIICPKIRNASNDFINGVPLTLSTAATGINGIHTGYEL